MSITFGQADPFWVSPLVNFVAVVLGGAITWITTRHFESKTKTEADLAQAYALVFKIQFYADEIWKIDRQIKAAKERSAAEGFEGPLWSKLYDIVGLDESPERISSEELALVARTKDVELVAKVREIETGHAILKQTLSKIHQFRLHLSSSGFARSVNGRVVSFEGPPEKYAEIAPIIIGLNDLSEGLDDMCCRVSSNASDVAGKIGNHLKSNYKFENFISLTVPNESEST